MFRMETIQYNLPQSHIPQSWYNILPDLPTPLAPPLHPGTLKPIGPDDLAPLFPMGLILQEVSNERESSLASQKQRIEAETEPTEQRLQLPIVTCATHRRAYRPCFTVVQFRQPCCT